ncbi:response regulator transcription factor [Nocardia macrotermitis]|uniref:Transcriptional activator protein CzcR n=1 Tax=Nocardia macrotermitis TaxID=2585198 RepID=A0A7K0D0D6_9NOCA|nr:response regulator transcription factor [Nocardia macrotermitis]MQY19148.1 Transcriptional activator protein CzcR [Nocardia macrotermitis]
MRVLLVEDEAGLAETVRRGLEHEGFHVEIAGNGVDGLWMATEFDFDVIVLDIMMPGLSGYEVLRGIRAGDVSTPVLMLTAKNGALDEADALDMGADNYLTKPFSFVVLIARIRALMRRQSPQQREILTVGDLALDPSQRSVRRGGVELSLTPREFGLLEFLMRNPGTVVSKSEILRNVWDSHYDGPDNVVAVYIRYLRSKIDIPFDRTTLKTHRGVGYQLAD